MSGTDTLPRTGLPVAVGRVSGARIGLPDALVAVAVGAVAFIVRKYVPPDGLFYDDAWQAFGAWKGSFSEILTVGMTQPGFTAGLMLWTRLLGISTAALVTPALIAGTLGPPAVYAGLRWFGFARSIALLIAAALSSAQVHIIYSYHVKTYTFDVLIILGLALVVWRLADHHWRRRTAVAWLVGSVLVGLFSSIALIAAGVAGVVLAVHPSGDRRLRTCAVAGELAVLATLFIASSRAYNSGALLAFWEARDAFIDFHLNPLTFGRELFDHFWHVADVFPGGRTSLSLAAAVIGISMAAWRGPLVVPARFLGLTVVVAAAGSVMGQVPFGPPRGLGRVSLWLVPVTAMGLAMALQTVHQRIAARTALRPVFDTILTITAVVVLISALGTDHPYSAGARSAIRHVMELAEQKDAIVITRPTTYSFALYGDTPVDVKATPERQIGFLPDFSDTRLLSHDFTTTMGQLEAFVEGADRVYVVHANVGTRAYGRYLLGLAIGLKGLGFVISETRVVATGVVQTWQR
jgi:hypothetical protein